MKVGKNAQYRLFDVATIFIVALLYVINNIFLKRMCCCTALNTFFVGYFNDLICPLGFISYLNIVFSYINHRIKKWWEIQLWTLGAGMIWEYFAPLVKPTAVADPYDLLCYIFGAGFYYLWNRVFVPDC